MYYKEIIDDATTATADIDTVTIANVMLIIYTITLLKSVCLSVDVIKLLVAILIRSCREMFQTVRIDCIPANLR